jgi:hypothetical protein
MLIEAWTRRSWHWQCQCASHSLRIMMAPSVSSESALACFVVAQFERPRCGADPHLNLRVSDLAGRGLAESARVYPEMSRLGMVMWSFKLKERNAAAATATTTVHPRGTGTVRSQTPAPSTEGVSGRIRRRRATANTYGTVLTYKLKPRLKPSFFFDPWRCTKPRLNPALTLGDARHRVLSLGGLSSRSNRSSVPF